MCFDKPLQAEGNERKWPAGFNSTAVLIIILASPGNEGTFKRSIQFLSMLCFGEGGATVGTVYTRMTRDSHSDAVGD